MPRGHPQFGAKILACENLTPSPPLLLRFRLRISRVRLDAAREILAERGGRAPHACALTNNRCVRRRVSASSADIYLYLWMRPRRRMAFAKEGECHPHRLSHPPAWSHDSPETSPAAQATPPPYHRHAGSARRRGQTVRSSCRSRAGPQSRRDWRRRGTSWS